MSLGLLGITRWVIASVFPADMSRPGFVSRLFLPFLITHDALPRRASIRLRHASLSTMLATHILPAFQVICFRHFDLSRCGTPSHLVRCHASTIVIAYLAY